MNRASISPTRRCGVVLVAQRLRDRSSHKVLTDPLTLSGEYWPTHALIRSPVSGWGGVEISILVPGDHLTHLFPALGNSHRPSRLQLPALRCSPFAIRASRPSVGRNVRQERFRMSRRGAGLGRLCAPSTLRPYGESLRAGVGGEKPNRVRFVRGSGKASVYGADRPVCPLAKHPPIHVAFGPAELRSEQGLWVFGTERPGPFQTCCPAKIHRK